MFRKKEPEEYVLIFLVIGIILFLSSIFTPFIFITVVQDILYRPEVDFWFFQAPFSSYIAVGSVCAYLGILFLVLAFIQSKIEGKKLVKTLYTSLAIIPGIIIVFLSVNQYFYFTDQGIHQNSFFSVEEKLYNWSDMEEVHFVSVYKDHVRSLSHAEFRTDKGDVITFEFNKELQQNRYRIRHALEAEGIKIKQVEEAE